MTRSSKKVLWCATAAIALFTGAGGVAAQPGQSIRSKIGSTAQAVPAPQKPRVKMEPTLSVLHPVKREQVVAAVRDWHGLLPLEFQYQDGAWTAAEQMPKSWGRLTDSFAITRFYSRRALKEPCPAYQWFKINVPGLTRRGFHVDTHDTFPSYRPYIQTHFKEKGSFYQNTEGTQGMQVYQKNDDIFIYVPIGEYLVPVVNQYLCGGGFTAVVSLKGPAGIDPVTGKALPPTRSPN